MKSLLLPTFGIGHFVHHKVFGKIPQCTVELKVFTTTNPTTFGTIRNQAIIGGP